MADIAKAVIESCCTCWADTAKYRKYIRILGSNLTDLKRKRDALDSVRVGVLRLVSDAEKGRRWIRTEDVAAWLGRVEEQKEEVNTILEDGEEMMGRRCLCGICFSNCRARYMLSVLAEEKIGTLERELGDGRDFCNNNNTVAYEPSDIVLERSLKALRGKSNELQSFFETLEQRVKSEEENHMVCTLRVGRWLKRVEDLLGKEVKKILEEGDQELKKIYQMGGVDPQSQRNLPSHLGIANRSDELRAILEQNLKEGGSFTDLTRKPDEPLLLEIALEPPVGVESMFEEVWNWVEDKTVRCIGLYGMGGVGKTTLLDKIQNHFVQKLVNEYNFAIRVVVSKQPNLEKIQEAILIKLKLPRYQWEDLDRQGKASRILSLMKEKNFALFLDDVWDSINLFKDLGIPERYDTKQCKIILTTRDLGVCNDMDTDKDKKVECLPFDDALLLFRQKLGDKTWGDDPMIHEIAKEMVRKCNNLPLAIVIVAGAMARTTDLKEWMAAEKELKCRLSDFEDMSSKVLEVLEFSYNRLPDDIHRECFRYLSIFPEDHEILVDDVIALWIGEGFLAKYVVVDDASSCGSKIFTRLKQACLVESVQKASWVGGKLVKMHDMVREMALWVASEHGKKGNNVLVQQEPQSTEFKKWRAAERVSLWGGAPSLLNRFPTISCPHLSTLILRGTRLRKIPGAFFLSMPSLKVLDVSDNNDLVELPDSAGKLLNLQYLNLYDTAITELPVGVKNMTKLDFLILPLKCVCPPEVISDLSSIRAFSRFTRYPSNNVSMGVVKEDEEDTELKMLEVLQEQGVGDISLGLSFAKCVEKLLSCPELLSRFRCLLMRHCGSLNSFRVSRTSLASMKLLQVLRLSSLPDLLGIDIDSGCGDPQKPSRSVVCYGCFASLTTVIIDRADKLRDLTSLIDHAHFLEKLHVTNCLSLREVISIEMEVSRARASKEYFHSLTHLNLYYLPELESICQRALPFGSLQSVEVLGCPKLKKLPLDCDSANNSLREIIGEEEWWEDLKWDNPAAQEVFSSKFVRGPESVDEEVWDWIEDDTVICIGILGMGGIGKKTLLNNIHNRFLKVSHDYDMTLRLVPFHPLNLDKLRESVLRKLKVPENEWKDLDGKGRIALIRCLMQEKNFLLFLEDVWEVIDLDNDLGIPWRDHQKKCKSIFTSRNNDVCHWMKADKRKMLACLPQGKALRLFRRKLGEKTWRAHPMIPEIAAKLLSMSGYLPITISILARAMAGVIEPECWMEAERDLRSRVSELQENICGQLFSLLEFSYGRLPSEIHKTCFLYLSTFPEDREIFMDDVIDLWIEEGFLDEGDVRVARSNGETIFRTLEHACLVELVKVDGWDRKVVRMHGIVRRLAMLMASGDKRMRPGKRALLLPQASPTDSPSRA